MTHFQIRHFYLNSHLQQGSIFSFFFVLYIYIYIIFVVSWSFQLSLFKCTLPGASGNNETLRHGKIISLLSSHTVVLLTHDPGPQLSICLSHAQCLTPSWIYLSLPLNYLLMSPTITPKPTCGALGQRLILWGKAGLLVVCQHLATLSCLSSWNRHKTDRGLPDQRMPLNKHD